MRVTRIAVLCIVLSSASARADTGQFGLGLILGQPTGITGAYELSDHTAIDAALGLALFDGRDFYLHVEFLYTLPTLVRGDTVDLSAYLGIGGWLVTVDPPVIGARAPFGLSIDFNSVPVQIFAELSLLVALTPDNGADIRGAAGFRYYF